MLGTTRRGFLGAIAAPAVGAAALARLAPRLEPSGTSRALAALRALPPASVDPEEAARDEDFWFEVAQAFDVDRSALNLNNGGVSPAPGMVIDAQTRHLLHTNQLPAHHLWRELEPQRETVRRRLAAAFGCDKEELALVRNATEGLQICQLGIDLEPGDEVLTTTQDYPRMIAAFRQRERCEGIRMCQLTLPVPAEDDDALVELFESHLTPRTRLLLLCHVVNLTGQVLPVRRIVAMARARGVPAIVDGAHALAHLAFELRELECDYYASSLHKWLNAPIGTGALFVRRERIASLWPLTAADERFEDDVRKFEEIGTHAEAPTLAVADALLFHEGIGAARKEARLRHLRDRWARRLLGTGRVRLLTSLAPGHAAGFATFAADGLEPRALSDWLWRERRIFTVAILHEEVRGVRVSPGVYTSPADLDGFCDAVEEALRRGLPGTDAGSR